MSEAMISIRIDGATCDIPAGVTLAHALSARAPALRLSPRDAAPRGLFCGMGLCFECMVEVDGIRRRACLTPVRAGMEVRTGAADPGELP